MRPWGWGIVGGMAGLVAGFVATVAIGLVAFEFFHVSQHEGAAAMGLVFFIGPVGAVMGAIMGAALAVWLARRAACAARPASEGSASWPLRLVLATVAGAVLGYWTGVGLLQLALALRGSRSFDSYAIAYALSHIPTLSMLAAAALGAWIALRRRPGQATGNPNSPA